MTAGTTAAFPYQDATLPVEQRVADLLSRMTLEDKAGLLFHDIVAPGPGGALMGEGNPFARPATKLWRPAIVSVALASAFFASNVKIEVRDGRYLSPQEMVTNLRSVGSDDEASGARDATREWRLQWWKDIVGYTVFERGVEVAHADAL